MDNEYNSFIDKIVQSVQETEDDFIFETVRPFCEDIIHAKISKQDLARAVINYHGSRITIYDSKEICPACRAVLDSPLYKGSNVCYCYRCGRKILRNWNREEDNNECNDRSNILPTE